LNRRAQRVVRETFELRPEHDDVSRNAHVAAHAAGHDVVVARQHDHVDAMRMKGGDRLTGRLLRRIEKPNEAGEHELLLVGDGIEILRDGDGLVGNRDDAEPVLIECSEDGGRLVAQRVREGQHLIAEIHLRADPWS
jgi:hypothetical protein